MVVRSGNLARMGDAGYVIETDRLGLRPYRLDDLDSLAPILGDAEHMKYYPHPFGREESLDWIRRQLDRYRDDGFGLWAIEEKATGEFLGNCGPAVQIVDGEREVELGWHVKPERCRRGIASEAAAPCRDYSFAELGVERLIALCRPENVASCRVADKIGMTIWKETDHKGLHHRVYYAGAAEI